MVLKLIKTNKMVQLFGSGIDFSSENLNDQDITSYRLNHLTGIKEILRTQILDIDEIEDDIKQIHKTVKVATTDKTFVLWQRKLTIAEIAEERKLSVQTIYQHIAKLIGEDKIDITAIISVKKLAILKELFQNNTDKTLTEIKAEAPENITWEDLRIYKSSLASASTK